MYKAKLDNCCCEPSIKMEFTFPKEKVEDVICIATGGFRSVEIINNETGEVAYSCYISDEHFNINCQYCSIASCIKDLLEFVTFPRGY